MRSGAPSTKTSKPDLVFIVTEVAERGADRRRPRSLLFELAGQIELCLELDRSHHRLVGRRVPLIELADQERAAVRADGESRVLAVNSRYLPSSSSSSSFN